MIGQLRIDIVELFRQKFEDDCISLLLEGFHSLALSGRKMADYSENDITAQLVGFMKGNPRRKDLQISIQRENYIDCELTYQGLISADESPRIDIKYNTWSGKDEYEYYMEAKNLAEDDWQKSNLSRIEANKLRKRYIDTGIGNFLSGRYKNGCLIGYVIQGNSDRIIDKINSILKQHNRETEILVREDRHWPASFYVSSHSSNYVARLQHFLISFPN